MADGLQAVAERGGTMVAMMKLMKGIGCLTLILGSIAWANPAPDEEKEKKIVVNEQMVLYGNSHKFSKPATCNSANVFKNIAEYQQIQKDGLTQKDAKYWILLEQANQKFSKALADVAKTKSHDLVAEVGGITAEGVDVPDLTDAVNEKVKA